jgi:hypothetical protein
VVDQDDERTHMDYADLISDYWAGPQMLRATVAGMTAEQLDARPIPGKWSTKQVIPATPKTFVRFGRSLK